MAIAEQLAGPESLWCGDHFSETFSESRRLPVLNYVKRLVGMVSLGDLAMHAGGQPLAGAVLEQVSAPGKSGHK